MSEKVATVMYFVSGVTGPTLALYCLLRLRGPMCKVPGYVDGQYVAIQTCNVWLWYGAAAVSGISMLLAAWYYLKLIFPSPPHTFGEKK